MNNDASFIVGVIKPMLFGAAADYPNIVPTPSTGSTQPS